VLLQNAVKVTVEHLSEHVVICGWNTSMVHLVRTL
jgi:hypothetical protein